MSMTGQLYRVSATRLQELLANPAQIQPELYPDDYPDNMTRQGCDVEKTWDAIPFVLDRLAERGKIPCVEPLFGGAETGCCLHYGPVWYRAPEQVAEIATALSSISRSDFRQAFSASEMAAAKLYPDIWDCESEDDSFDYVWPYFQDLVQFYQTAAAHGEAVLVHLA